MKKKDYYEMLGIEKQANIDEIEKAFIKISKNKHSNTHEKNLSIIEAYIVLSDKKLREEYDKKEFSDRPFLDLVKQYCDEYVQYMQANLTDNLNDFKVYREYKNQENVNQNTSIYFKYNENLISILRRRLEYQIEATKSNGKSMRKFSLVTGTFTVAVVALSSVAIVLDNAASFITIFGWLVPLGVTAAFYHSYKTSTRNAYEYQKMLDIHDYSCSNMSEKSKPYTK